MDMQPMRYEKLKKYLPGIVILLLVICGAQGWVIYKHMRHPSADSILFGGNTAFPSFNDKQFKKQMDDNRKLFDHFFNRGFFSQKSDPFQEMQRFRRQFNNMMQNPGGNMFGNSWDDWLGGGYPGDSTGIRINTDEKKDAYVITLEIPNLRENKLNIDIEKGSVSIQGEFSQKVEKKDDNGNVIGESERHQSISRKIPIADDADYDHAKIDHKGDKVIITIPKRRASI